MSYNSAANLAYDMDLQRRVIACAALEGIRNPVAWATSRAWDLAAQPGWADTYAYAVSAGAVTRPGHAEDVITDPMILSAVQAIAAADEARGPEDGTETEGAPA